jgi:hypothetical protein
MQSHLTDSSTIVRKRVPDGATTVLGSFVTLSDMCSFTVATAYNRWYWHHEGSAQFRFDDESTGFCRATFGR